MDGIISQWEAVKFALRDVIGGEIAALLARSDCTDVLLNEGGDVWLDSHSTGCVDTGIRVGPSEAMSILGLLAHCSGVVVNATHPLLDATIPGSGERVAGTVPPVTSAATAAIRKPPKSVYKLEDFPISDEDFDHDDDDTSCPYEIVRNAVRRRDNLLIIGGTGSGKTSFLSALMTQQEFADDRNLVIEDSPEAFISAPNHIRFRTCEGVSQLDLVNHCLRYRGDRIIIGEVRSGDVALAALNALGSGNPGSGLTFHADSIEHAFRRYGLLCQQACGDRQTEAIADAFHLAVFVRRNRRTRQREIRGLARTAGVSGDKVLLNTIV